MKPSILLLEPQSFMRQATSSRLRLLGLEHQSFDSLAAASVALSQFENGIVLAPLESENFSGLDLLWYLRQNQSQATVLLSTDTPDPLLNASLRHLGACLTDSHPARLAEVFKRLQQDDYQLKFQLDNITLFDLIQLISQAEANTHLYLTDPDSGAEGLIYFQQGQIKHAIYDQLTGEEAFFKIMSLNTGLFMETDFGRAEYYTISSQTSSLIARSALRQDDSVLDPVEIILFDPSEQISTLLSRNFPPQRLALSSLTELDEHSPIPAANLLIIDIDSLGDAIFATVSAIEAHFNGPILLVGSQAQAGVAEALCLEQVEQFYLHHLQLQNLLAFIQHRCFNQRFSGQLHHLSLFDCLQILGFSAVPMAISCQDALSGERGEILVGQGQIHQARFGGYSGVEALTLCLKIDTGLIHIQEASPLKESGESQALTRIMMQLVQNDQTDFPSELYLQDGRHLIPQAELIWEITGKEAPPSNSDLYLNS